MFKGGSRKCSPLRGDPASWGGGKTLGHPSGHQAGFLEGEMKEGSKPGGLKLPQRVKKIYGAPLVIEKGAGEKRKETCTGSPGQMAMRMRCINPRRP